MFFSMKIVSIVVIGGFEIQKNDRYESLVLRCPAQFIEDLETDAQTTGKAASISGSASLHSNATYVIGPFTSALHTSLGA